MASRSLWVLPLLLAACGTDNECVTPQGCGPEQLCVSNRCVGTDVEGDPRALYASEFRLRLDTECGICHFAGANGKGVAPGDGSWRLYSGADLSADEIEASWQDVQDFVKPGDAVASLLLTYARGEASIDPERDGTKAPHPAVYQSVENLSYARVIGWLSLFELPPLPAAAPPGEDGYGAVIHGLLVQGCSCHTAPERAWKIAGPDPDAAALAESYAATTAWVSAADPEASPLLGYTRGEYGHSAGRIWAPGDPQYDLIRDWIRTTGP